MPGNGDGIRACDIGAFEFPPVVKIDIEPGIFPNRINPKSKRPIKVAILTTDAFDATTVDPLSIKFGPKEAMVGQGQSHLEDVDRDGALDLVLFFPTQDTGITCGALSAALTGQTFDSQVIMGSDSIKTVGCFVRHSLIIRHGLIAYWSFDDGTARDNSGNGFDGEVFGDPPTVIPGIRGKALQFDGNTFISVEGDELGMTRSTERTISLWANPSSLPGDGLVSKYFAFNVAESNYYASMFLDNGKVVTVLTGLGIDGLFVTAGEIGKWQHLVFVMKDGVGESKVYLNGILVGQGTLTYNDVISSEPLTIAKIGHLDDEPKFHGALDEIRIYNRVLTEKEIRALSRTRGAAKD